MRAGRFVVVASKGMAAGLRAQLRGQPNALVFTDADYMIALDTILGDPPELIALDPEFAATPRGASLVAAIKADPRLAKSDIRVIVKKGADSKLAPLTSFGEATSPALQPLDRCGTRRVARFPVNDQLEVRLNGAPAELVNLSVSGAELLAPIRVRPSERIRLVLTDNSTEVRLAGVVAWATLEITSPSEEQRYRFGVEFRNVDRQAIEKYCRRYRQEDAAATA